MMTCQVERVVTCSKAPIQTSSSTYACCHSVKHEPTLACYYPHLFIMPHRRCDSIFNIFKQITLLHTFGSLLYRTVGVAKNILHQIQHTRDRVLHTSFFVRGGGVTSTLPTQLAKPESHVASINSTCYRWETRNTHTSPQKKHDCRRSFGTFGTFGTFATRNTRAASHRS